VGRVATSPFGVGAAPRTVADWVAAPTDVRVDAGEHAKLR
jgi:hypothetical protein